MRKARSSPPAPGVPAKYFIESLARGLAVLAAFSPGRPELSLSDVARVAEVTTPSALRIGHTLVHLGYLNRNAATRGYRLGPKVLSLGMATLSSMSLPEIAEPYLRELRDRTGETVKLSMLHDTEIIFVARYPSLKYDSMNIQIGSALPAHVTSMGRAILAQLPVAEARAIVERSRREKLTERTITGVDEIMAEIRRTRERGYGINDRGIVEERRSIAAALVSVSGRPIGAINIAVSAERATLERMQREFVPELLRTAEQISELLAPQIEGLSVTPRRAG
jgi:IclR family transcriptional regulator, pca regulon regulatory protein